MMKWKEFLSVMDFGISHMPSLVSVIGMLPYFERPWIPVIIGLAVLFGLIALFIHNNLGKKEKALAEILATGYFINFLEPMAKNIGKTTEVFFRDEQSSHLFDIDCIEITVYMPMNSDSLVEISDVLNNQKGYKNVDIINAMDGTPFWARAKAEENRIKIADFPRTLFSLPRFVKISLGHTKPNKIKQYYEGFAEKLEDLLEDNRQDYVLRKVKVERI